jgi:hypothetical protein
MQKLYKVKVCIIIFLPFFLVLMRFFMSSQYCELLNVEGCMCLDHIIQSHYNMCLFGAHFKLQGLP